MVIADIITKHGTLAEFEEANLVYKKGQKLYVTDVGREKMGDGVSTFLELDWFVTKENIGLGNVTNVEAIPLSEKGHTVATLTEGRLEESQVPLQVVRQDAEGTFLVRHVRSASSPAYDNRDPLILSAGEMAWKPLSWRYSNEGVCIRGEDGLSVTSSIDNLASGEAGLRHSLLTGVLLRINEKDVYANETLFANTINLAEAPVVTSDERYKQDIQVLNEKELAVALEISGISFRLKEGGAKQIGVSAQQLVEVFEKNGLDPYDYAINVKNVWYEYTKTKTSESGEEFSTTETVYSIDEIPEDVEYVTHEKLGVRYEQLISLVLLGVQKYLTNLHAEFAELKQKVLN